jgi:hypothetical protein
LETYRFCEGTVPSGYALDFEESLFNQEAHRFLQSTEGWHSFYIVHEKQKKISAAIHFHLSGKIAKSPLRAPFGSLEFAQSTPLDVVFDFLLFFEERLRSMGVTGIVIKNYPNAYNDQNASVSQTFFTNLNYVITAAEVDSVMDVNPGEVQELFHRSHRQRFDKALQAGLIFQEIPSHEVRTAYTFIDQCQQAKGYRLSMDHDQMQKTVKTFPDHYKIFGVFSERELVAASIAIHVQPNIMYDFCHDHAPAYDDLSPVVTLIAGIYRYCQSNAVNLLDLGTSASGGKPNFSLLHFKRCLGSRPTPKQTFEKKLE